MSSRRGYVHRVSFSRRRGPPGELADRPSGVASASSKMADAAGIPSAGHAHADGLGTGAKSSATVIRRHLDQQLPVLDRLISVTRLRTSPGAGHGPRGGRRASSWPSSSPLSTGSRGRAIGVDEESNGRRGHLRWAARHTHAVGRHGVMRGAAGRSASAGFSVARATRTRRSPWHTSISPSPCCAAAPSCETTLRGRLLLEWVCPSVCALSLLSASSPPADLAPARPPRRPGKRSGRPIRRRSDGPAAAAPMRSPSRGRARCRADEHSGSSAGPRFGRVILPSDPRIASLTAAGSARGRHAPLPARRSRRRSRQLELVGGGHPHRRRGRRCSLGAPQDRRAAGG